VVTCEDRFGHVDETKRYDEERNMTRVAFKKSVISSGEQSWMFPSLQPLSLQ
jgi:hypothetical protein